MPDVIINVKTKGARKASLSIKSLTKSLLAIGATYATVSKAADIMKDSINMSAELEGVKRGFDNLAKSSGFSTQTFDKLSKATDGTIDSLTLMKQANNAMLLGIADSEDQVANMFDVAQRLGQALGRDTPSSIESLVTGLGRQSKLMLDNLGIMVDVEKANSDYASAIGKTTAELTDQERKTAFTIATMKEANRLVGQLGDEQLTTKDKISQLSTATKDLAADFGEMLAPSVIKIAGVLTTFARGASEFIEWANGIDTAKEAEEQFNKEAGETEALLDRLSKQTGFVTDDSAGLVSQLREMSQHLRENEWDTWWDKWGLKGTANPRFAALKELVDQIEDVRQAQKDSMELEEDIDYDAKAEALKRLNKQNSEFLAGLQQQPQLFEDIKVANTDLTKEQLKNYALTSGSAKDAMKAVVKAESMEAVAGFIASILKGVPFPLNAVLAAGGGAAVSGLIDKGLSKFATGGDFVTNGPEMIMVGDNTGGRERVQVTPLSSPNIDGPTSGSVTVNVSGNVMSKDFVEGELAEQIKEAIRRGSDFGIG